MAGGGLRRAVNISGFSHGPAFRALDGSQGFRAVHVDTMGCNGPRGTSGGIVFVNLIYFPEIKKGKEEAFLAWFDESNRRLSSFPGFVRRTLLEPVSAGQYVGLIEHASKKTFMDMHHSPTQAELRMLGRSIFDGEPDPQFYEIVRGV